MQTFDVSLSEARNLLALNVCISWFSSELGGEGWRKRHVKREADVEKIADVLAAKSSTPKFRHVVDALYLK